jgi:hypothetical protein
MLSDDTVATERIGSDASGWELSNYGFLLVLSGLRADSFEITGKKQVQACANSTSRSVSPHGSHGSSDIKQWEPRIDYERFEIA